MVAGMIDTGRKPNRRQGTDTRTGAELSDFCRRLVTRRSDPIGTGRAAQFTQAYQTLTAEQRGFFFDRLLEDYAPDSDRIIAAARAYKENPGFKTHRSLAKAVEAPRQNLFRSINMAPGGTSTLVKMRQHMLELSMPQRVRLRAVEHDLKEVLRSWFHRGFLHLRRVDWDSPASLLEKIITYEAVHQIQTFEDLRRRLEADRRCFAFFHPSMPHEPLVFVEIALTQGLAREIQPLLARDSQVAGGRDIDTAMFYSINNCQTGLRGISFGGFLIKQVVQELRQELPQLTTFATLSPVPGFQSWLGQQSEGSVSASPIGRQAMRTRQELQQHGDWYRNAEVQQSLQLPLLRLCAHYLLHEKLDGWPIDAVARFHLGNGASLQHMNWLADTSPRGLAQSAGMMVNYVYDLGRIEKRHDQYINKGEVSVSEVIRQLAAELAEGQE